VVKGLELFREYFSSYRGQYILIGGTACDLVMEDAGQTFRGTKDLDIVLCAEALTDDFIAAFWTFVRDGGYSSREKAGGKKEFYRFRNPVTDDFPKELELFSRHLDSLGLPVDCTLTPIPAGENVSSLSAILLDDDSYYWILAGTQELQGVRIAGTAHLIPLKMKAWLDLSQRKERGEVIDNRTIKKHLNDVFRLFTILPIIPMGNTPTVIRKDIQLFLERTKRIDVDFKSLGLGSLTLPKFFEGLKAVYGIEDLL
jgi:hypothetical protein